jgi:hypothetical protein
MAKNLGAEFATMDEDERRKFGGKGTSGTAGQAQELDFDEPRDADRMGEHAGPRSEKRRQQEQAEMAESGADPEEDAPTEPPAA